MQVILDVRKLKRKEVIKVKRLVIILAILVLSASIAWALESEIRGTVYKGLTQTPAVGATVVLSYSPQAWADTVLTDVNGDYSILSPYEGTHSIWAWKLYGEEPIKWSDGPYEVELDFMHVEWKNLYLSP